MDRTVTGSVDRSRVVAGSLTILLAVGIVAGAVPASAADAPESAFVVDVDADGDADVALTLVFDLDDGDERDAFEELDGDAEAREDLRERFADRMASVAAEAGEATDREMVVSSAEISLDSRDGYGVVVLSAGWSNLAAVEGGSATVSEPFASGFALEQRFELVGPDGYAVADASPTADDQNGDRLAWSAGTDLEGFAVTFADNEAEATPEPEPEDQPGFGAIVAIGAVLAALIAARRYRTDTGGL